MNRAESATATQRPAGAKSREVVHKSRMPSILFGIVALVFAVISLANLKYILLDDENVFNFVELKQENLRMGKVIAKLEADNQQLREEIINLRRDPQTIEEEARSKLNLVKEGEILYLDKE